MTRKWTPSLHPRGKGGRFKKKNSGPQNVALAAIAAAPVVSTSAVALKGISLIAPMSGFGRNALIASAGLQVARSTSTARKIYIGYPIQRKRGNAAYAKFLRVNARIDRGLSYASAGAGVVGAGGLIYKNSRAPKFTSSKHGRLYAKNVIGRRLRGARGPKPSPDWAKARYGKGPKKR